MSKVEFHPATKLFPEMDEESYQLLKADIKEHGLLTGITFYDGKLLDGRSRYRACLELGIDPKFHSEEVTDIPTKLDPIAWLTSMNLCRAHRTEEQIQQALDKAQALYVVAMQAVMQAG